TIDFYADNRQDKEGWMGALCECIGKEDAKGKSATWTDLVLARERANAKAAAKSVVDDANDKPERAAVSRASTNASTIRAASKSAPNSPVKSDGLNAGKGAAGPVGQRKNSDAPLPPTPSGRLVDTPPMGQRKGGKERAAVRSMIF
ncbi:Bud site selection protein bud4, partial [Elasticomyces elasticus]